MKKGDLLLSPKHGVNPAIPLCFYCNKPKNEVVLAGRLPNDQEAPANRVWDHRPCDECAGFMKLGVILISTKDGETGDNPYRTGGWCVVKAEAVEQIITTPDVRTAVLAKRVAFVPDAAWAALGLPRGEHGAQTISCP